MTALISHFLLAVYLAAFNKLRFTVAAVDNILKAEQPYVFLEEHCNGTVQLPCISSTNYTNHGYSGTIKFWEMPFATCLVTVVADKCPDVTNGRFKLYFNIREANIPQEDKLEIYHLLPAASENLLKRIYKSENRNSKRASVSQLQTDVFTDVLRLRFDLVRSKAEVGQQHQIQLDYTVVSVAKTAVFSIEKYPENIPGDWIRCPALEGFVNRDLVCGQNDMISCPNKYAPNKFSTNPADDVDQRNCVSFKDKRTVFRDDFNGISLNTRKWNIRTHTDESGEATVYKVSDNAYVANGSLHMRFERIMTNATISYRVAHISTAKTFSFAYGEVEFRAKFPLFNSEFPTLTMVRLIRPECEFEGSEACQTEAFTLADYRSRAAQRVDVAVNHKFKDHSYIHNGEIDMGTEFHTYVMSWTKELVVWYIDDKEVHRLDDPGRIPSSSMRFFIELAVYPRQEIAPNESVEAVFDYVVIRGENMEVELPVRQQEIQGGFALWKVWVISVSVAGAVCVTILAACRIKRYVGNRGISRMRRCQIAFTPGAQFSKKDAIDNEIYNWNVPVHFPGVLMVPETTLIFEFGKVGEGQFGVVRKATATKPSGCEGPVAVKTIRNAGVHSENPLREEVKVHSQILRHLNIVNLLGITIANDELHIILEYAQHGCLLTYLRKHEILFGTLQGKENTYLNGASSGMIMANPLPDDWPLQEKDLVNFAYQISRGMAHLALHNVIHRDLAARNVLVCNNKVLKICDFGLAKQKTDYYRMPDCKERVPAKWMSPESIDERLFSEKSDVWSFGIVIWEIFSFGKVPYGEIISEFSLEELKSVLKKGVRPSKPTRCPASVYDIMEVCWKYTAAERPTFAAIEESLELLLEKETKSNYIFLDEPYVLFNISHGANGTTDYITRNTL